MIIKMITTTVSTLNNSIEYDINVTTDANDRFVHLTFHPVRYPGDAQYPDSDLEHGFPVADYTVSYGIKIPKNPTTLANRTTLDYLQRVVTDGAWADEWDLNRMRWTSTETALENPPAMIADFMAGLPRRSRQHELV